MTGLQSPTDDDNESDIEDVQVNLDLDSALSRTTAPEPEVLKSTAVSR